MNGKTKSKEQNINLFIKQKENLNVLKIQLNIMLVHYIELMVQLIIVYAQVVIK